jgi:hypothetical protein
VHTSPRPLQDVLRQKAELYSIAIQYAMSWLSKSISCYWFTRGETQLHRSFAASPLELSNSLLPDDMVHHPTQCRRRKTSGYNTRAFMGCPVIQNSSKHLALQKARERNHFEVQTETMASLIDHTHSEHPALQQAQEQVNL